MEVYVNGELIYDRKQTGGYPSYTDVTQMKMTLLEKAPVLAEA